VCHGVRASPLDAPEGERRRIDRRVTANWRANQQGSTTLDWGRQDLHYFCGAIAFGPFMS